MAEMRRESMVDIRALLDVLEQGSEPDPPADLLTADEFFGR
jgi:hypothetical protein